MIKNLFKNGKLLTLIILSFFCIFNVSCTDFRQAIGKEKYIPNEYSFLNTPRLVMPPDFGNTDNIIKKGSNVINKGLNFKNKIKNSKFDELFDFSSIPKNIRKLVDDETLGISRSERTGIDVLTGKSPKVGVFLESEEEAIRIKNIKGESLIKKPSPSINTIDGKKLLIK